MILIEFKKDALNHMNPETKINFAQQYIKNYTDDYSVNFSESLLTKGGNFIDLGDTSKDFEENSYIPVIDRATNVITIGILPSGVITAGLIFKSKKLLADVMINIDLSIWLMFFGLHGDYWSEIKLDDEVFQISNDLEEGDPRTGSADNFDEDALKYTGIDKGSKDDEYDEYDDEEFDFDEDDECEEEEFPFDDDEEETDTDELPF